MGRCVLAVFKLLIRVIGGMCGCVLEGDFRSRFEHDLLLVGVPGDCKHGYSCGAGWLQRYSFESQPPSTQSGMIRH